MKKVSCLVIACLLCAIAQGICPAYFGISGYRKSDGQFVSAGGTLTEQQAAQGYYYFGKTAQAGAIDVYGGIVNAVPAANDKVNVFMNTLSSGAGWGTIDLSGKVSPAIISSWILERAGITNVIVTWSMDKGLWLRFQNATKYDAVITDREGGKTWNIAAGTGVTITHRDSWARLTVDTTGAKKGTKLKLWSVDTGGTIAESSSFSNFEIGRGNGVQWFGRVRLDDVSDYEKKESLVYSDMLANTGMPIYGSTNTLLYSDFHSLGSNVMAWTEWQFDQSKVGNPIAYINDINVCDGHATGHIIMHNISTEDPWGHYDKHTGIYTFEYTMSIGRLDEECLSTEPCVYRTWFDASTYDDAEPTARASFSGTVSDKPKFVAKFYAFKGEWKVELAP